MTAPREPRRLAETDSATGRLLARARTASEAPRPGARERIWNKAAQPRAARSWLWLLAPPIAIAASLLVLVARPAPGPFATLALTSGQVEASPGSGGWTAVKVGAQLPERTRLRTGAQGRAYARFADSGALLLADTDALLYREGEGAHVRLESGMVVASVRARAGRQPFALVAGDYTVEVVGTLFSVQVASDRTVGVYVHDGSVRVHGPATDVVVRDGHSWSSRSGPGVERFGDHEAALARALRDPANEEVPLELSGQPGMKLSLDGVDLGSGSVAVLTARGAHAVGGSIEGRSSTRDVIAGPGSRIELPAPPLREGDEQVAALRQKVEATIGPAERATAAYELARSLTLEGRHAEAIELYGVISRDADGRAEASLYEIGRIKLRHLSDPAGAAEAFAEHRVRFPQGALSPEVALSQIEAHLGLARFGEALGEMNAFAARYPDSERLGEIRFLRATVLRDRDECGEALPDYVSLIGAPKHGDDALYYAAYCEQVIGQTEGARRRLTQYLAKFPNGKHREQARAALKGR